MASTNEALTVDSAAGEEPGEPYVGTTDELIGMTLHDSYALKRVLGEGGMGKVYEAHHTRIAGKRFAIKVLRAEMKHSSEVMVRFQREADAAASIHHPNVIDVHDFGNTPDGRPYIVSDLLEGVPLDDFIAKKKHVEMTLAVHIARQVCHGLIAAHEKGVIHRDLKPENIFLLGALDRPSIKVLDFGLSRFMETTAGNTVTRSGIAMGTPAYMAPEQARGDKMDHRVDIYGVGSVLYAMLTGKPPFEEESPQQTVLAVMSKDPIRPRMRAPWLSEDLELVIQRAMAREPSERYASMAELDAALAVFDIPETGAAAAPRQEILSRLGSTDDDADPSTARGQVVLMLLFAMALAMFGLLTALLGVPELFGMTRRLTTLEFALMVVAITGTVLTPLFLALRWLRRRLWNNSVRMVSLVPRLRGPLVAAIAAYALLELGMRGFDGFRAQFGAHGTVPGLSGWPGFGPILLAVALVAAIASAARRRVLAPSSGIVRRFIAGPVVVGGALVASGALVFLGLRARAGALPVALPQPDLPTSGPSALAPPPPVPALAKATSVPEEIPAPAVPPPAPKELAPPEEVAMAIPQGVDALSALRVHYPKDPAVLEPLAIALGDKPGNEVQELEVLDALFSVAPQKVLDKELGAMVLKASRGSGDVAARALDLMAKRMGRRGADMLYDAMTTNPALRVAARERLDDPAVHKSFTPALKVAYELRVAKTCEDRVPLLERAGSDGDLRAFVLLKNLGTKTKHGCGYRKQKPCPAPCSAQAAEFDKAAAQIQKRLAAAAGVPG